MILSVADYYATRTARKLAHEVKEDNAEAISEMAADMIEILAGLIPMNSVLVPVPSSKGFASNTLALAHKISEVTNIPVRDVVRGYHREPWYVLKQKGLTATVVSEQYFGFHLKESIGSDIPVIIDSVYDTGRTTDTLLRLLNRPAIIVTHSRVRSSKGMSL